MREALSRAFAPAAIAALALLLAIPACSDSDPTGPSSRETLTNASVFEDGRRILQLRRDAPANNRWRFAPNQTSGAQPPEGEGAPSFLSLKVTTFPESAGSGGQWLELEFEARGLELPLEPGRYPVAFVPADERLLAENLGVLTGELKMGRGLGGLELWAEAVSGELIVNSVVRNDPPSRRILLDGRIEVDFREISPASGESPRMVRAAVDFRSANHQGF